MEYKENKTSILKYNQHTFDIFYNPFSLLFKTYLKCVFSKVWLMERHAITWADLF